MLKVVGPMLLLFGMVTGVIYSGVATPTEASALGAFGAFVPGDLEGQDQSAVRCAAPCCARRTAPA